MPVYRIYALGTDQHITKPATVVETEADRAAIGEAKRLLTGESIEVRAGRRLVTRLSPDRDLQRRALYEVQRSKQ